MYTRLFILIMLCYSVVQCADISNSRSREEIFEPRTPEEQPDMPPGLTPPQKSFPHAKHGCCSVSCGPRTSCCPQWMVVCFHALLCCSPPAQSQHADEFILDE